MPQKTDLDEPSRLRKILNLIMKKFFNKKIKSYSITNSQQFDSSLQNLHEESVIVENLGGFAEKNADDVMIPRADIIAVRHDITLEELKKVIVKNTHTRTLVYKENLDQIIGFVHIKDLFETIAKSRKFNLKKITRKHLVSPHSMKLVDLLRQMQIQRTHITVIVDEYGGTDGIVTIEDIIEAIVGKIDDEHDADLDTNNVRILHDGELIVNARMEIKELEQIISTKLSKEEDEFDTIGGLVLAKLGKIPAKGEVIKINNKITVEIVTSTPRNIKQLKITYKE